MKLLIAAGGTGGHIYPGIAVANEIMRRSPASEVLFVGTARGLETKIVPENGYQLSLIHSAGLKSVGAKGLIKGLAILPKSFIEAAKLLREFKPDVVVGAGGYVSGPVLLTASLLGFSTLIMDSNALPGFTNRRLARFVDRAALAFEEALPYFGKKGTVTGNPVRKEFFDIEQRVADDKVNLLVFGGSQGARAINNAVVESLSEMNGLRQRVNITHQTGDADFERIQNAYQTAEWHSAAVKPYISDMMNQFSHTDLVICRAGATTCAELAAAGKASIMIPLPTAADDHQRKNAEALEKVGASRMILQSELDGKELAKTIKELVEDPKQLAHMGCTARKLAKKDAAEATADIIEELAKQ